MKTTDKAKAVISEILAGKSVSEIRQDLSIDDNDWYRISAKAYSLHIVDARQKREKESKKANVIATSCDEISDLLELNDHLANYALCLPTIATKHDLNVVLSLLPMMPQSEDRLLLLIEEMTLGPRIRAMQNVGRIRQFSIFKDFSGLVEAATLCYYRGNYPSSFLTLVPVVEGIILKWSGYQGVGKKPEFDQIRKFFKNAHVRNPCPGNPLFHNIFCKVSDKIISDHFYLHSEKGGAYAEFNRHQAAHLMRGAIFATKENCIRLFLLLDMMTEIYYYESRCRDPRLYLTTEEISKEIMLYKELQISMALGNTPESILLLKKNTA
jgi:hypothetical protein